MKVTIFADMKAEGWPSMDRYAKALAREFSTFNFQFSTFSVEPPIRGSKVKMFWRQEIYPRWARLNQGQVNHILDQSYGHLLNFLNPKRTVITCHDLLPLEFEKDLEIRERFRQTITNLKRAALIIADSQATKADLVRCLGLAEGRIRVIFLGVDPVFRPIDSTEEKKRLRKKFGLPGGKIIFSHGQAHLVYKNTEGILRSFVETARSRRDVYLLRVNPLTVAQLSILKASGLTDRLFEIENPSDEDLAALYNLADVFLSPSFKEGFGLPVLQALACGTPAVVSRGTSLEEITGDSGFYVNPDDIEGIVRVVNQILGGEIDRTVSQKKAVERARLFSWPETAKKTYEVYEEVFKSIKV